MKKLITELSYFGAAEQAAENTVPAKEEAGDASAGTDGGQAETAEAPEAAMGQAAGETGEPEQAGQTAAPKKTDDREAHYLSVMRAARFAARVKAANAAAERWRNEARELQKVYPSFSLEESLRNDSCFTSLLRAGLPVKRAYEAANLEKIVGTAMRYAAESARRRTAQAVRSGTGRVRENPVIDRAGAVTKKDVGSMTEREIIAILKQVSEGKRVTF